MRVTLSSAHADGIFVALILDDAVTLAVHAPPEQEYGLVDVPTDIAALAPDLILLALSEPPGPGPATPQVARAQVSMLSSLDFAAGHLTIPHGDALVHCYALVGSPHTQRVEVLGPAQIVALVATGLVTQVLSRVAEHAAYDLDTELRNLINEGDDSPPSH